MLATILITLAPSCAFPVEPGEGGEFPGRVVASVSITPEEVRIVPPGARQFVVELRDADGNLVAEGVTWEATGGTISTAGLYTAGPESGDFFAVARSSNGLTDTARVTISEVPNTPPIAAFSYTCADLVCDFDATGSSDSVGSIVAYIWTFGEVSAVEDRGPLLRHRFPSRSRTMVRLTVVDNDGEQDSTDQEIDPSNGAPSTWIYPGEDIQAAVDGHPAGTEFIIKAGVHRMHRIKPKDGNTFTGEGTAIISGARLLDSFSQEGSYWVVGDQTQQGSIAGTCTGKIRNPDGSAYTGCVYPEDVFLDDQMLRQVVEKGAVGPGTWFFDYAADMVYIGDNPQGHVVEVSVTRLAFDNSADNVTIRNLIIEKYANPAQVGAIQIGSHDAETLRSGWIVQDNEIRFNHGVGLRLGHAARVLRNNIHHNGQMGIGGTGDDVLIEGNEIAYNNTAGYSAGWEAGGTKFVKTHNLVVRGNNVHHNDGPGLWTDGSNMNTTYENNRVADNIAAGIFHEISYHAVIRDNVVERNGFGLSSWMYGAGILIAHSPDVEVYNNIVTDNFNGIAAIQQARGVGVYGPFVLSNLWVHHNTVTMKVGLTGIATDTGDNAIYESVGNNRFDHNTYYLGSNSTYFTFLNAPRTDAQWQGYGQDINGTITR